MSRAKSMLLRLRKDCQGSVIVEFAILAPVLFTLLLGVMTMGLHLFSSNALSSVASDTARFTVVEYQKLDELTDEQIESKAVALAVNAPYGLEIDRLTAAITRPATDIAGTNRYLLTLSYTPYNPLEFAGIGSPTIVRRRTFYVAP